VATVRLDLEYDGSGFRGWAAQPGLRTVQGELEAALATILRRPVPLTVAGRTDTGVHALGQVASFETGAELPKDLARRLNGVGPDDIGVISAEIVADGFDAELVQRVARMVDAAEWKRRQYPPGTKISFKAFGRDRRLPITNRWREGTS
jgi:tRNA pseudouridine38-40 synthase